MGRDGKSEMELQIVQQETDDILSSVSLLSESFFEGGDGDVEDSAFGIAIAGFVLFGVRFENHVAVGIILTQPAASLGVGNGCQIIIGIVFERNDTAGGWSSGGDWWWKGRLKVFFRRPLMSI